MGKRNAELAFLPAALEIEQTPPLPISRLILWAIVAFFAIGIAWSCIGQMNIVGVAHGKIVPSGRVKVVQPAQAGVVQAIHIAEGARVIAGDLLIELDATNARADLDRLRQEQYTRIWDRYRLQVLLNRLGRLTPGQASAGVTEPPRVPAIVTARIENDFRAYAAQAQAIAEEVSRNRAERLVVERRIAGLDAIIPLITERVAALAQLQKQALAPRASWLELEEARIGRVRERDVLRAQLAVADASHGNLTERRAVLLAQTGSEWLAELADTENRIASYAHEIRKARTRVHEHHLTAPVTGTIQQLTVTTVGGVVTPAENLMLIVPDEDALQIEAWVRNEDIGFVDSGQAAEIKVETFPFTKYGVIDGEVKHVSNDAIADENLGLVYLAQIKMARTAVRVRDELVNLSPGMAVTVELDMGTRRLIEFLLTPLLRYRDESLRER